jgi:transcriptional regulator with XRE-family HTH domain
MTFGDLLRATRKQVSMSQRELGQRVGADFTYISKIEHGRMVPSAELTRKMALALGADPFEFWETADNTPREMLKLMAVRYREALEWADGRLDTLIKMTERGHQFDASDLREILGPVRRARRIPIGYVNTPLPEPPA